MANKAVTRGLRSLEVYQVLGSTAVKGIADLESSQVLGATAVKGITDPECSQLSSSSNNSRCSPMAGVRDWVTLCLSVDTGLLVDTGLSVDTGLPVVVKSHVS